MKKNKLLLHQCCAPCSVEVVAELKQSFSLTGFWYNPNIHPVSEYLRRWESLALYDRQEGIELIKEEDSSPLWWQEITVGWESKKERCRLCYQLRLKRTAQAAQQLKIKNFSTTLLASPYQNHQQIAELGARLAKTYNLKFFYQDFRPAYFTGKNSARQRGFYLQKYCGCLYSREERIAKRKNNQLTVRANPALIIKA
ncbi:MAG: epoxyqueuosine reductase QueH [Elusimicrobiota bacterium]